MKYSFDVTENLLTCKIKGEFEAGDIMEFDRQLHSIQLVGIKKITLSLLDASMLSSASSVYIDSLRSRLANDGIEFLTLSSSQKVSSMLSMVQKQNIRHGAVYGAKVSVLELFGRSGYKHYANIMDFVAFLGELFLHKMTYLWRWRDLRFREIAFEINENAIKALPIVMITSFLIGLVVAYQAAHQLKLYGANIFIVDMMGISVLRELAPVITAIVIAGRSGSAYTAQIGAMKITQELDAMQTMGFDPYRFLVLPRIIALMLTLPILIFVADIMALFGGVVVANINLGVTPTLFMDRFSDVVAVKHFVVGVAKGPFFAFLITTIGIYRGLKVKDDTQSIGKNTTKSVVEAIFAVIICDALFSIFFTRLGI